MELREGELNGIKGGGIEWNYGEKSGGNYGWVN